MFEQHDSNETMSIQTNDTLSLYEKEQSMKQKSKGFLKNIEFCLENLFEKYELPEDCKKQVQDRCQQIFGKIKDKSFERVTSYSIASAIYFVVLEENKFAISQKDKKYVKFNLQMYLSNLPYTLRPQTLKKAISFLHLEEESKRLSLIEQCLNVCRVCIQSMHNDNIYSLLIERCTRLLELIEPVIKSERSDTIGEAVAHFVCQRTLRTYPQLFTQSAQIFLQRVQGNVDIMNKINSTLCS